MLLKRDRKLICFTASLLCITIFNFSCREDSERTISRPNIIIILADDLGYGDIGAYNKISLIPTPNLDKLASEGISLTNAYCPVAVCSPSRFALMTGTYPWRSWNPSGVMRNYERSMIDKNQLTLPQMLQQVGYKTAGFGKWHLGTSFPTLDGKKPIGHGKFRADDNGANLDLSKLVYDGPVDHGFDHWVGFSCASECWILDGKKITGALDHDYYTIEAATGTENLEIIPMDGYLRYITEKSLAFVEGQKAEKEPFFLYFAPYVPHTPLAPSTSFKGTTEAGTYGDFVAELDNAIGEILNALDNQGLSENTIVLFASDNGSALQVSYKGIRDSDALNKLGGHPIDIANYPIRDSIDTKGQTAHYPNGILKGTKSTAWEGGVRTPLIARWPKKFPANKKSDLLFALNDVMPSIAGILNIELPEKAALDGYNLTPILKGEKENLRKSVVVQSSNNVFGLRKGKWKFIDNGNRESPKASDELYDLSIDPSESKNLARANPEIAEMMKSELYLLLKSNTSKTDTNNFSKN